MRVFLACFFGVALAFLAVDLGWSAVTGHFASAGPAVAVAAVAAVLLGWAYPRLND